MNLRGKNVDGGVSRNDNEQSQATKYDIAIKKLYERKITSFNVKTARAI